MLQVIKQMEQQGRWAEIRQQASVLLAGLEGDALARGYLATSKAFELTATSPADYRTALAHARAAVASALQGGLMHTWALARVAAYSADMGLYRAAEATARTFLEQLPVNPGAAPMEPYALYALGRALSRLGKHTEALIALRRAESLLPAGDLQERVRITTARALARAGRVEAALSVLPVSVEYVSASKLHAARALILAQACRWAEADADGRLALKASHEQALYDVVEAAELLLTLKAAAQVLGRFDQAAVWLVHTAALLSRWGAEALLGLLSTLRVGGGAVLHEAASRCGSSGDHRCGLRGTLG